MQNKNLAWFCICRRWDKHSKCSLTGAKTCRLVRCTRSEVNSVNYYNSQRCSLQGQLWSYGSFRFVSLTFSALFSPCCAQRLDAENLVLSLLGFLKNVSNANTVVDECLGLFLPLETWRTSSIVRSFQSFWIAPSLGSCRVPGSIQRWNSSANSLLSPKAAPQMLCVLLTVPAAHTWDTAVCCLPISQWLYSGCQLELEGHPDLFLSVCSVKKNKKSSHRLKLSFILIGYEKLNFVANH